MRYGTGIICGIFALAAVNSAMAAQFVIREYDDRIVVEYDGSNDGSASAPPAFTEKLTAIPPRVYDPEQAQDEVRKINQARINRSVDKATKKAEIRMAQKRRQAQIRGE